MLLLVLLYCVLALQHPCTGVWSFARLCSDLLCTAPPKSVGPYSEQKSTEVFSKPTFSVTEAGRWEGISGDQLVQPPVQNIHGSIRLSGQVLNISKDGVSKVSLAPLLLFYHPYGKKAFFLRPVCFPYSDLYLLPLVLLLCTSERNLTVTSVLSC